MTNEPSPSLDAQKVWQQQPSEALRPSIEDLRRQAGTFERQIAWRNAREYVAATVAAVCNAAILWRASDTLVRLGAALVIAGLFYVVWQLHARGAARRLPAELGRATGLEFLKRDLTHQRDLLRGVWRWYLGPLVPGLVVLFVAAARANPGASIEATWPIGAAAAVVALVFLVIWRLNVRAARGLDARIDELDEAAR